MEFSESRARVKRQCFRGQEEEGHELAFGSTATPLSHTRDPLFPLFSSPRVFLRCQTVLNQTLRNRGADILEN